MPSIFQSERLTYRAMRPDDLEELYEIFNDPDVIIGLSSDALVPRAANFKDKIKRWSEGNPLFVIAVESQTGVFVGQGSIRYEASPSRRDGELGIVVKKTMWGKGYGTEMCSWIVQHGFKFLGLHRVSLGVFASNARALATYKRVGFVQEGILRRVRFCNGSWEDVVLMGIVEDEFFAKSTTA